MGTLSLKDKVCILTSWALMLMSSAAERDYFPQATSLTWEDARSHCQACFEDLVTLTSENTQKITVNLTSDHWVGLRKNLHPASNSTMFWSRWANGDPLAFQNWYPGWPVLKPPSPESVCCSCSCTCPARTTSPTYVTPFSGPTDSTDFNVSSSSTDGVTLGPTSIGGMVGPTSTGGTDGPTSTGGTDGPTSTGGMGGPTSTAGSTPTGPLEAECVRSPMPSQNVSNTDQNYIEDSCVAMLSFGAWVERNCSEHLPFICYEVRFIGNVTVSDVTTQRATLEWEPGPGNISHYRLEVRGDTNWEENTTGLTSTLSKLTAGTRYSARVIPVKCRRDLNPQEVGFYTIPNKVENLKADNQTESSVTLSWGTPSGKVDFYVIKFNGQETQSERNSTEVSKLKPGNLYTFSVLSGVSDETTRSEESNITVYTKPGAVSNLKVFDNSDTSLWLSWKKPSGQYTDFRVKATSDNNTVFHDKITKGTEDKVTNLTMGTKINLSVTARANHSLEGDSVSTVGYTTPGPVSNLTLVATSDSIQATWNFTEGTSPSFKITLKLDGKEVRTLKTNEATENIPDLKNAANYTVSVLITNGELNGPEVSKSIFTSPSPPTNLNVTSVGKTNITFKWDKPINASTVKYSVKLSSRFWGHSFSATVDKETHQFTGLNPGTRYEFEVQTLVGDERSSTEGLSQSTEAEKREISLAMLCSSPEVLLCDNATTRKFVFEQLLTHFQSKLQNDIFWELERPN